MLYYTYITTFLSVKPYFSWWRGEGGAAAAGGGRWCSRLALSFFASEVCSFEHEALDNRSPAAPTLDRATVHCPTRKRLDDSPAGAEKVQAGTLHRAAARRSSLTTPNGGGASVVASSSRSRSCVV